MLKNVGGIDRVARIIMGLALIAAGIILGKWWISVIGIVPLVTGFIRVCPLYFPCKMNTNKPKNKK